MHRVGGRLDEARSAGGPARCQIGRDVFSTATASANGGPAAACTRASTAGPSSARHETQKHCGSEETGRLGERVERERQRVRRLPGGIEGRLEVDVLGLELRGDVAHQRGDVLDRLGRGRAEAVAGRRAVEQPRRRVRVRGRELAVVEPDDPRTEPQPAPFARLAEPQQRLGASAFGDERAVAGRVWLDVHRRPRQHADAPVAREDAAAAVIDDCDRDGVATELEHLRRERVGLHVLELLRVEEDLDARAHAKLRRTSSLGSMPSPGPSGSRATRPSMSSGTASETSSS